MWVALASCGDRAGRLDGIEQQGNDHSRSRRKEDQSHRYHGKRCGTCGRADGAEPKALLLRTKSTFTSPQFWKYCGLLRFELFSCRLLRAGQIALQITIHTTQSTLQITTVERAIAPETARTVPVDPPRELAVLYSMPRACWTGSRRATSHAGSSPAASSKTRAELRRARRARPHARGRRQGRRACWRLWQALTCQRHLAAHET